MPGPQTDHGSAEDLGRPPPDAVIAVHEHRDQWPDRDRASDQTSIVPCDEIDRRLFPPALQAAESVRSPGANAECPS